MMAIGLLLRPRLPSKPLRIIVVGENTFLGPSAEYFQPHALLLRNADWLVAALFRELRIINLRGQLGLIIVSNNLRETSAILKDP
jgi:hypothetical protein